MAPQATTILRIPEVPSEADVILTQAADLLRRGGLVAFPTETVYGLGANAHDVHAIQRLFQAKGRPANNPLIVHLAEIAGVRQVVAVWPEAAERLAHRFWPGPLTLVLPKQSSMPDIVTGGGPTVAVRIPAHPIARRLVQLAAVPVAAPSANRSGELSPTTAEHVRRSMEGRIDLILDAGPTQVGLESTVVSLAESPPRLLRPGHITPAQIEEIIGPIQWSSDTPRQSSAPVPSPGLLGRHYAPRTAAEAHEGINLARVQKLADAGLRIGWLTWTDADESFPDQIVVRRLPADPVAYAASLYAVLHELDQLGLDRIVIDLPPATGEWLAVRDRLKRASAQD